MKELSIEEKAKAYDEAIKKAKDMLSYKEVRREDMEYLFPELKESEDEKIRKEIIAHCRNTRCVTEEGAERIAKWIAWLEKQGELVNSLTKGLDNAHERIDELIQKNNELCINLEKQGKQKPKRMISAEAKEALLNESEREALRTEYEKGRADVIADTLSWLANVWPQYCSNPNIIDAYKEGVVKD